MTEYIGDKVISGIAYNTKYNAHHLLDFKWTDCIMSDVSWLRADTFSWQSGDVYTSAYNHLVQDIQGITSETETIGSYTVTFYRATDGHKICLADQETTVANIYSETGIAWYYILDTTNTQFKLPRTKYGFEGLRTNVGDKIDESLPNIKGTTSPISDDNLVENSGCFYIGTESVRYCAPYTTLTGRIRFDASRSSSTYQDNAPVQERATQMFLYFYVGDYTQTAVEQTAGLNSDLFNGKADLDLDNINPSQTAKNTIIGWGMPDYPSLISLGSVSNYYTIPCDSLVVVYGNGGGTYTDCYIDVKDLNDNQVNIGISNYFIGGSVLYGISVCVPLPKGYKVKSLSGGKITIVPLKGAD